MKKTQKQDFFYYLHPQRRNWATCKELPLRCRFLDTQVCFHHQVLISLMQITKWHIPRVHHSVQRVAWVQI